MKLLVIGNLRWSVLAVYDDRDDCSVMDGLIDYGKSNSCAKRVLNDLRENIPENGPIYSNQDKVKKLKGDNEIYEFRWQPKHGPKPRVLFFKDGDKVVICTHAFLKGKKETPKGLIDEAEDIREEYMDDKDNGELYYETIEGD